MKDNQRLLQFLRAELKAIENGELWPCERSALEGPLGI